MSDDRHVLLSVLFFQEPDSPDLWVAQALEHDITAYGIDVAGARRALTRTLSGYYLLGERHQKDPFAGIQPAPDVFWTIWRRLIAAQGTSVAAESLETLPAYMIPAVSHEPLSPAH